MISRRRVSGAAVSKRRVGKTPTRRFSLIDREKINDALADAFAPDLFERLSDRHLGIEQRKIFSRVLDNRRIEIRNAGGRQAFPTSTR